MIKANKSFIKNIPMPNNYITKLSHPFFFEILNYLETLKFIKFVPIII